MSDNSICETMWSGVPCQNIYEFSLRHKAVYNYAMPYLKTLMMTSPEVSDNPKNNLTNP